MNGLSRIVLATVAVAIACGANACAGQRAELVLAAGVEAHRAGDHVAAALKYREALRLAPEVRGAWRNLSVLALVAERPADAVDLAREEVRLHPGDPEAGVHLALVQLRAGHDEAALVTLRPLVAAPSEKESATAGPEAAARSALVADQARLLLALALWRLGRPAEALKPLGPLLTLERGAAFLAERAVLASTARTIGSWLALDREDWAAVLAEPASHPVATAWARHKSGAGAVTDALPPESADAGHAAWLGLMAALGPDADDSGLSVAAGPAAPLAVRVAALRLRASRAAARGDWAKALADLEAAAAAMPEPLPALWLDRSVALAHLGREDEARIAVAGVLRDAPDHPRALQLRDVLGR